MAIVLGSCGVLFLLLVLLAPEGKMSKWEAGAIMLGVLLFTALLGWIINKVMYMRRGGKYRTRYELDTETLRVLYDSGSSSAMRKMGGVVAAAGVLAGDIGGALTGAGMAGAGQGAELKLKQIRSITLRPGQDYIMIHTLVQHAPVYVPKEDFDEVKAFILARIPEKARERSVRGQ